MSELEAEHGKKTKHEHAPAKGYYMTLEKKNRLWRAVGLWAAFLGLPLVMWACLQMRLIAEESIFIAEPIVAAGYVLCPVVIILGVIVANSYKIEDPKRQSACLMVSIALLVILVAALYIAWQLDYPRALEEKNAFWKGRGA